MKMNVQSMREEIKAAMEDLFQKNCICNYTFIQNGQEMYRENMYALDAYMLAYSMSENGNVECYMTPDGKRAYKPIFTVIDGSVTLSGLKISPANAIKAGGV